MLAMSELPHPESGMVSIEVARAEVNSMSGFQRESVYRLSKFNKWLGDRFPLGAPHKGFTPLLQTQEGLIEHSMPMFSLMTKSKLGRPKHAYITYEQIVNIALKAGTDVRGMMRAFMQRNVLEEDQIAEISEIADGQLLPDDLQSQLPGMIVDGRIRAYHGILY